MPKWLLLRTLIAVIVFVENLTTLGWVISQSTGLKLAAESVVRASEAMAATRQMHPTIKNERFFCCCFLNNFK